MIILHRDFSHRNLEFGQRFLLGFFILAKRRHETVSPEKLNLAKIKRNLDWELKTPHVQLN